MNNHFEKFLARLLQMSVIVFCLQGCSQQLSPPDLYPGFQIRFGQGGGFTGLKTEYAILKDGHSYKQTAGQDTFRYERQFDKTFVDQAMKNIELLKLQELELNSPGDLYYFIEFKEGEKSKRLVWGNPGERPPQSLVAYYQLLYKSMKTEKK